MRAWEVNRPGLIGVELVERPAPEPAPGEVRVRVSTCGVCRTDLHIAEGDLPPVRERVVLGHEIVGVVDANGPGASRFELGDRIGIAWLRMTCGRCRFCLGGDENLCVEPRFTGYTDDGGYADFAVVPEDYAYSLPAAFDDEHAAPLLCAGIIGFRALRRSALPEGGRLGIYGFGGSAHLASQVAIAEGARVHVITRSEKARALALGLGATSARELSDGPPERLDSAILFAPSGELVPTALQALDRGGTLAIAGIHLTPIPPLVHDRHLSMERTITSVNANTRRDGEEFLEIATRIGIEVTTTPFGLDEADRALRALAHGRVEGAAVLHAILSSA
ncbi:MAG: zinc-dependent alcohol dehydrogenase family protein [Actinomycetota bacterium]